jgi:hypothetical protein
MIKVHNKIDFSIKNANIVVDNIHEEISKFGDLAGDDFLNKELDFAYLMLDWLNRMQEVSDEKDNHTITNK